MVLGGWSKNSLNHESSSDMSRHSSCSRLSKEDIISIEEMTRWEIYHAKFYLHFWENQNFKRYQELFIIWWPTFTRITWQGELWSKLCFKNFVRTLLLLMLHMINMVIWPICYLPTLLQSHGQGATQTCLWWIGLIIPTDTRCRYILLLFCCFVGMGKKFWCGLCKCLVRYWVPIVFLPSLYLTGNSH